MTPAKFTGKSKNPKLEWSFTANPDGTVNLSIRARKLRVREVRGKLHYEILTWLSSLPIPLNLDGCSMETRVVLKLYARPKQSEIPALRWGKLHKLANRHA